MHVALKGAAAYLFKPKTCYLLSSALNFDNQWAWHVVREKFYYLFIMF